MERASRVQLQQHTNGAQPSVTGGVQGRPSGPAHGPRGKVDSTPGSRGPSVSGAARDEPRTEPTDISFSKSLHESNETPRRPIGPKSSGSLQNVRLKSGSLPSMMRKTGSQHSVGPRIRFQVDGDIGGSDKIPDKQ